jgi:hypothetical protein
MVKLFAASLALAASLAAFAPAHAEGGCGWGAHRGPYGGCRPNGGPVVAPRAGVVVAVPGAVIYAPLGRACPVGFHLGPQGRRCWAN